MKYFIFCYSSFFFICCFSCTQKENAGSPLVSPEKITSTVMGWVTYQRKNIKLYDTFAPYDTVSKKMERGEFIRLVSEGKYFPVALSSNDSLPHYKLYPFKNSVDKVIKMVIKDYGKTAYSHYVMEGKPLPGLDFADINDRIYNSETTSNKIVVIKCWFIGCHACVLEMPALNKMVEKYKGRNDVIFVSLAFDKKEDLRKFLKRKRFDYAVVAEKAEYMDDLKIRMFPTHILIDKSGMVKAVTNSADEIIPLVDNMAGKGDSM